ncbi:MULTISPECIES: hypothetical protein [unclassified Variovorax]|uniref:hypothetical protein n=1 Tax=unclassified Variovorax TaxID=663243 RepID=UPI000AE0A67E|nr:MULTISPECIES: hypothetical protein [unclassified Variovorax]PNG50250.1 hypothetical protein CHC06_05873 [Variovorax sp. B2]PNG51123.1 hypothetical protein CHC07_05779 [Variovorax sp. B4]VTV17320.1 hypothetical protein WDL1P1_00293 [Variovorax sp. WDL1]
MTTTQPRSGQVSALRLTPRQRTLICGMMHQPQRQAWRHYEHPATFDSLISRGLAKVVSTKREKVVRAELTVSGARAWAKLTGNVLDEPAPKGKAVKPAAIEHSEAELVFAALATGHWTVERNLPLSYLTAAANKRNAWSVRRREAPFCADRRDSPRSWSAPTAQKALTAACADLKLPLPQPDKA